MASDVAAEAPTATAEPLVDRWIDLFGLDDALSLQPEMFDQAIQELEALLHARPAARDETVELLQLQFARGMEKGTWGAVTSTLSRYCGIAPAYLVNWLIYQNTENRLAMLEERADAATIGYLRFVVSRFWDELNAAQIAVSTSVNDWSKIDKNAHFDTLGGGYRFTIRLTKVNGEVVQLEMTPDSLMNLTGHLLVMIGAVASASEFNPERIQLFVDQLRPVIGLLSPPDDEDDAAAPDAVEAPAATE